MNKIKIIPMLIILTAPAALFCMSTVSTKNNSVKPVAPTQIKGKNEIANVAASDVSVSKNTEKTSPAVISAPVIAPTHLAATDINLSIGSVDVYKVFRESEQARENESNIMAEFDSRKKIVEEAYIKLRKLQEELQSMGTTIKSSVREAKIEEMRELQKTIEVKAQGLEEYKNRATQEAQMRILKEVEETSEEIRKERGLLIIFAGGTLAVDPSIDVSSTVAQRMNQKYAAKRERQQAPKRLS